MSPRGTWGTDHRVIDTWCDWERLVGFQVTMWEGFLPVSITIISWVNTDGCVLSVQDRDRGFKSCSSVAWIFNGVWKTTVIVEASWCFEKKQLELSKVPMSSWADEIWFVETWQNQSWFPPEEAPECTPVPHNWSHPRVLVFLFESKDVRQSPSLGVRVLYILIWEPEILFWRNFVLKGIKNPQNQGSKMSWQPRRKFEKWHWVSYHNDPCYLNHYCCKFNVVLGPILKKAPVRTGGTL
jgi:hypothetical protein